MLNPVGVAQAIANAAVKPRTKGGSIKVTQADKEKKDRAMAKAILDKLGMETEKYRLGYTKVFSTYNVSNAGLERKTPQNLGL